MGISNAVACLGGIIFPVMVQQIIKPDIHDSNLWMNCFYVVAGFSWTSVFVFLLFGSGSVQEWAKVKYNYNALIMSIN